LASLSNDPPLLDKVIHFYYNQDVESCLSHAIQGRYHNKDNAKAN